MYTFLIRSATTRTLLMTLFILESFCCKKSLLHIKLKKWIKKKLLLPKSFTQTVTEMTRKHYYDQIRMISARLNSSKKIFLMLVISTNWDCDRNSYFDLRRALFSVDWLLVRMCLGPNISKHFIKVPKTETLQLQLPCMTFFLSLALEMVKHF